MAITTPGIAVRDIKYNKNFTLVLEPIFKDFFLSLYKLKNLKITKEIKIDSSTKLIINKNWILNEFNSINPFPAKVWIVKKPIIRDRIMIIPIA